MNTFSHRYYSGSDFVPGLQGRNSLADGSLFIPAHVKRDTWGTSNINANFRPSFSLLVSLLIIFSSTISAKSFAIPFSVTAINLSATQTGSLVYGTSGNVTYTLTLNEAGDASSSTGITLNWISPTGVTFSPGTVTLTGDGQLVTLTVSTTATTQPGNYNFTVSADGQTSGTASFVVDKASPSIALASSLNPACTGSSVTFTATVTSVLSDATGSVEFFDGATSLGVSTLSGNTATINLPALSTASHNITATYQGDANYSTTTTASALTQVVSGVPTMASAGPDQSICGLSTAALAANTPTTGTGKWSVVAGTGGSFSDPTNPNATFTGFLGNNYTLRWTISSNPCTESYDDVEITLNKTATVQQPADQILCSTNPTAAIIFNGSGDTYTWTNDNTATGLAASGTGNIASFTSLNSTNAIQVSNIRVTATSNGCAGAYADFTITVKPTPVLTITNPAGLSETTCSGASIPQIDFSTNVTGSRYDWTRDNVSGVTGISGGVANFSRTNTSTAKIDGVFTSSLYSQATIGFVITPRNNGCFGAPKSVNVIVNPGDTITAISNQTVCNGSSTTAVNFSSPVPTTSFSWTNNNASIGLGANGSGNIGAFTATNTTNSPITATITVTPTYTNGVTCVGTKNQTFTITVNPTPTLTSATSFAPICNGTLFTYTPTSSATGVTNTFAWTRASISTNPAASGTGGVNETLLNVSTSQKNAVYVYTVTATYNGKSCSSAATSVTVPLDPKPTIEISPNTNQSFCTGSGMTPVTIGSANGSANNFKWYRTTASGAITSPTLGISGTTNPITGVLDNSTNTIKTVTFKALGTNTTTGCRSDTIFFIVQVNPPITGNTIQASHISEVSICGLTKQVTIATPAPNGGDGSYTYQWQVSSPNNDNYINIPGATAATMVYKIGTNSYFRRIAYSGGCSNTSPEVYITGPGGNTSTIAADCLGGSGMDIYVVASYIGANYTLQYDKDKNGNWVDATNQSVLAGDGDSLTFSNNSKLGLYRVSATIPGQCTQLVTGTVEILPNMIPDAPTTTSAVNPVICAGASANLFATLSTAPSGSNPAFLWYTQPSGGAPINLGNETPQGSGYSVNPTITTIYYAKSIYGSTGCKSSGRTSVTVTVKPTPQMSSASGATICSGNNVNLNYSNSLSNSTVIYTWKATNNPNITGSSNGTKTGNVLDDVLTNKTLVSDTVSYSVTPSITYVEGVCTGTTQIVKVAVNPQPAIGSAQTTSICTGGTFTITPTTGGVNTIPTSPATTYSWTAPTGTGFTGGTAGAGSTITGTLVNTGIAAVTATYNVTATSGSCSAPFSATVIVNPKPVITNQSITVCNGSISLPPFTGSNTIPANTKYTWAAPTGTNISGGSSGTDKNSITDNGLVNTSSPSVTKTATYTVTPTAPVGCAGNPFTISAAINPLPTATISGTTSVCQNGSAQITFTGTKGAAPFKFTYDINGSGSYTAITTSGNSVSIAASTAVAGDFQYNLLSVQDALSGTCAYPQTGSATLTVKAVPVIPNQVASICSGSPFVVLPTNNGSTVVPAGTKYTWAAPSVTGGITGGSSATGQSNISQVLTNNSTSTQTATYTVNPYTTTTPSCAGASFQVLVSVEPATGTNAVWKGTVSNDWCTAANWACGIIPTSTVSAVIPQGTPFEPAISGSCNASVKDLDLQGTATLTLDAGRGLAIYGGFINTSNPARYVLNGTVNFAGGNQNIPGFTYNGLTVSGPGNIVKTLSGAATVNGNLSLVNGIIVTTNTNMLTLGVDALVAKGYPNSHIEGPLTRLTNSTNEYIFPVGGNGESRDVYITPESATPSSYVVNYRMSAPTISNVLGSGLTGVQRNEYWDIRKNYGSDIIVGMDYINPNSLAAGANTTDWSSGINPCSSCNVAVAFGDAANNWYFTGSMGSPGFSPSQTTYWQSNNRVYSKLLEDNFGQFAFGYAYNIILPVQLISFTGMQTTTGNMLKWKLADITEVSSMELESSNDGVHFAKFSTLRPSSANTYQYLDNNVNDGNTYYRLIIYDKQGKKTFSNTVLLIRQGVITQIKILRPTIINSEAFVDMVAASDQSVSFNLYDIAGRHIRSFSREAVKGVNSIRISLQGVASGTYNLVVLTQDGVYKNFRCIKE